MKKTRQAEPGVPTGHRDSGIALITTLLLLSIMSLISLAMVLTVSSDMLINGYYRNYRGSFYAADSGLNIARQSLLSQAEAQIPSAFAVPPIPASAASTAVSNVLSSFGQGYTSLNVGQAATSWNEAFKISSATLVPAACTVTATTNPNPPAPPPAPACSSDPDATAFQYIYSYSLTSLGQSQGSEQETVSENGDITINVSGTTASSTVSFAAFGAFIENYPPCPEEGSGALVPGTMTGPMFTDGAWQFGTGGQYIFTDPVGQTNNDADYWFGSTCIQSPTTSYDHNGQLISPQFQGSPAPGFQLGQPQIALPQNAFSQEWAVLDGMGCGEGSSSCSNPQSPPPAPTDAQLNSTLKDISGNPYPTSGATSGVFLPYAPSPTTGKETVAGGGIYVQGNAQVTLEPSGISAEVYSIEQGTTITTITIDPVANTTTMVSGANPPLVLAGVPMNESADTPATMLYVDGNITNLSGPGQGDPAIQNNAAITVTATQNITVTGDVIYSSEPVTTTQNQIPGTPADTLIPANENNNEVLGMYTPGGNIILQSNYANDNLEVDGSLAATSSASNMGGFKVNGSINTFNNVGGQIQYSIYGAQMKTENTYFDRRFTARSGFAPPWFPSTSIAATGAQATSFAASVQRIQWVNTTALQ